MAWRVSMVRVIGILAVTAVMAGCSQVATQPTPLGFRSPVPLLPIPLDVQRMAILYPQGGNAEWHGAYSRLESAAFQLKASRPTLRIIDRSHMSAIVTEQRLQTGGLVSDDSAVRIGHMLGVDSVLIYRIDGPTLRDRFMARQHRDLPPVTVISKIIRVESAEVVYHNVVTAHPEDVERSGWMLSDNIDYHRWSREAVDRGIRQTVFDLRRAFE